MGTRQDRLFQALQDNNNSEVTIHHYFDVDPLRHTGILIQFTDAHGNVTSKFTIDVTKTRRGEDRLQELLECVVWHVEAEMVVNRIFPGQQSPNYEVTRPILRLPLDGQRNRSYAKSKVRNLLQKTSNTYNVLRNNCRDYSGRQIQKMCSDNQCDPNAVREAENNLQGITIQDALFYGISLIAVPGLIYWVITQLY